ncbi:hypothetical protein DOY81_014676 [Sarcophaga bullata]|nr:hypothetical protein DOY81_014676 [Sarcophaga bullata]
MAMDTAAANSTADLDFQLVCTLREIDPHNYSYLFQLCKNCNVNARQLRFLKKDHILELIPKNELGILAEFEYLLNQWQISKGFASFDTKIQLNRANESKNLINGPGKSQILSNNQTTKPEDSLTILGCNERDSQMPKANIEKFDEVEEFTLENLIPKVLKRCKEIYKRNKLLLAERRRLLCGL